MEAGQGSRGAIRQNLAWRGRYRAVDLRGGCHFQMRLASALRGFIAVINEIMRLRGSHCKTSPVCRI
ncbi:hypothetical protein KCP73_11170 [Salmonella enterica subsp. enterica]|nr:hypothetical protein KCP73_11170 [Salmonella enterica subsp. enterica]